MTKDDIADVRRWHRQALARPLRAGYDLVYVYAAHGLTTLQHFLSRRYNHRTDEYGGSLENRARLLREILEDTLDEVDGIRVVDYRETQLARLRNVELALESPVTAEEIAEYGFEHVAIATGARWRADGVGRWHTRPVEGLGRVLTPDDLLDGARPPGERVVPFDDDHYYMPVDRDAVPLRRDVPALSSAARAFDTSLA